MLESIILISISIRILVLLLELVYHLHYIFLTLVSISTLTLTIQNITIYLVRHVIIDISNNSSGSYVYKVISLRLSLLNTFTSNVIIHTKVLVHLLLF